MHRDIGVAWIDLPIRLDARLDGKEQSTHRPGANTRGTPQIDITLTGG